MQSLHHIPERLRLGREGLRCGGGVNSPLIEATGSSNFLRMSRNCDNIPLLSTNIVPPPAHPANLGQFNPTLFFFPRRPCRCSFLLPGTYSATRRAFLSLFKHQIPFLTLAPPPLPSLDPAPPHFSFSLRGRAELPPPRRHFSQNPTASSAGNSDQVSGRGISIGIWDLGVM